MKRYFTRSAAKEKNQSVIESKSDSDEGSDNFSTPSSLVDFCVHSPKPEVPPVLPIEFKLPDSDSDTSLPDSVTLVHNLFDTNSEHSHTKNFEEMPDPPPETVPLEKDFALKFIPEFSGKRDELHKFINCCDLLDQNYNELDSILFINIIKSKLTGAAYNVTKHKEFNTWDELKEILRDQFLEQRTYAQLQTDLVTSKQGLRESVRAYANRIEKLLSDLNDVSVASAGEESKQAVTTLNSKTALKSFVDGLHPEIRLIVKASRFERLVDAIEAAVEEEKSLPESSKNRYQSSNTNPPKAKCSICHKQGHSSANCFSRAHYNLPRYNSNKTVTKKEPISPSRTNDPNVRVITCSYCKNRGHHIKECRKRIFNESKTQV